MIFLVKSKKNGIREVLIDEEDFEMLSKYRWNIVKTGRSGNHLYVKSVCGILMSRMLLNCESEKLVDHINRDTLDNRKQNLRKVTKGQNQFNSIRPRKKLVSPYKGTVREARYKTIKWRGQIQFEGKKISSKPFLTEIEAAKAYNEMALKYFGEFALINQL